MYKSIEIHIGHKIRKYSIKLNRDHSPSTNITQSKVLRPKSSNCESYNWTREIPAAVLFVANVVTTSSV